jgi:hypothetical protein
MAATRHVCLSLNEEKKNVVGAVIFYSLNYLPTNTLFEGDSISFFFGFFLRLFILIFSFFFCLSKEKNCQLELHWPEARV